MSMEAAAGGDCVPVFRAGSAGCGWPGADDVVKAGRRPPAGRGLDDVEGRGMMAGRGSREAVG
jgi:hypothetical protein